MTTTPGPTTWVPGGHFLAFRRDPTFETATRIDEILRSPDVLRDLDAKPDATDRTED